jgi:hypothetical protein
MEKSLTYSLLWEGVCSYNNHGGYWPIEHYCTKAEPISETETDEPEYRAALRTKSPPDIEKYLRVWGMGRVLGKKRISTQGLAEIIHEGKNKLPPLANVTLSSYSREKNADAVKEIFEVFRRQLGPVAPGKILHILQPEMFVPWDGLVREVQHVYKHDYDGKEYEDYLNLLDLSKNDADALVSQTGKTPKELQNDYYKDGWKCLTKVLDELRWSQGKKLAPHFGTARR